jgi:hypothetical protein
VGQSQVDGGEVAFQVLYGEQVHADVVADGGRRGCGGRRCRYCVLVELACCRDGERFGCQTPQRVRVHEVRNPTHLEVEVEKAKRLTLPDSSLKH